MKCCRYLDQGLQKCFLRSLQLQPNLFPVLVGRKELACAVALEALSKAVLSPIKRHRTIIILWYVPCYNYAFRKTGGEYLDTDRIIGLLKDERERIDGAIAALEGGRSPKRTSAASVTSGGSQPRKRRHMSAEARKRISEAQKKRWAKQKKASK
jgi:hypothetical protein